MSESYLEQVRKNMEEYEKNKPPVNAEKMFCLKIDDKYQRSYLEYDGIDKMEFKLGPKGIKNQDYVSFYIPTEHIESIVCLVDPLKEEIIKYGENKRIANAETATYINKEKEQYKCLWTDNESKRMIQELETAIFKINPELEKIYMESMNRIIQEETDKALEEYINSTRLSVKTLQEKYPKLFDETGEFTEEGIQLIMSLINQYAPDMANNEIKKR